MKVDGQCQCGAIRYEAEIDPAQVSVCNCTDCQEFSGSGWRATVPAPAATFHLLAGKPRVYVKTAESGNKRAQHFCEVCGSHLWAAAPVDNPSAYSLRIGTVRQRAQLPPQRQIWRQSALPWAQDISQLPGPDRG